MRIRSFIVAYALVLAILLFADRRPRPAQPDRYSHVIDLTDGPDTARAVTLTESATRIIAPGALIPGTWAAGQIPPERLVAPLVVMDLSAATVDAQITLDDIASWEAQHAMVPQGAVIAIRRSAAIRRSGAPLGMPTNDQSTKAMPPTPLPITRDAAQFLSDARYVIGFVVETPVDFTADRTLARQLALRGNYVVERAARFASLPPTGSLVMVAPAKNKTPGEAPVRILAMVK